MAILVAGLAMVSVAALALADSALPPPLLWGVLIVVGASAGGWNGLSSVLAIETVGRASSGAAAAFNLIGLSLGAVVGPPAFGAIVDATGSYGAALVAAAAAPGVAMLLIWRTQPRPPAG